MFKRNFFFVLFLFLTSCSQESFLFHPTVLEKNHQYTFKQPFEEMFIPVDHKVKLNALLFQHPKSKGLIFFLHGNGSDLSHWGGAAELYLKNQYDFFVLDYRGFGKSNGKIRNEKELHNDILIAYNKIKETYKEEDIIILGYSFGTGIATKLASENSPRALILLAPYFSITDAVHSHFSMYPTSWVKYKLPTYQYIQKVKSPIYIFHGTEDTLLYPQLAQKLIPYLKADSKFFLLEKQDHNFIELNPTYQKKIKIILNNLSQ